MELMTFSVAITTEKGLKEKSSQHTHIHTDTLTNVSSSLNPQLVQIRNITKKLSPAVFTFLGITHIYETPTVSWPDYVLGTL